MTTSLHRILVCLVAVVAGGCVPPKGGGETKKLTITGPFILDTSRVLVVRNAGAMINTPDLEYAPAIDPAGTVLYFVRGYQQVDIWASGVLGDTLFDIPQRLPSPINSDAAEGAITFTADGRTVIFSACNRSDGVGDCDLYEVTTTTPGHATMRNVEEINSRDWDSQPSISSDGKHLYFVSNREGTTGDRGDADIYTSERQADGRWSKPRNIGRPVNSPEREDSPCLAMGDSVLFFSSSGHGGLGGVDIFASIRQPDGSWGRPRNLGEVFNSWRDDRFISVTPDGSTFYYASERKDLPNAGLLDIFVVRTVNGGR